MKRAYRNILNNRFSTIIILISLSVGITCMCLVGVFVQRELATDGFHKYSDRIYALSCDDPFAPGSRMYFAREGAARYMQDNFEQVEDYCLVKSTITNRVFVDNNSFFDKPNTLSVSPNFFDFFSYQLVAGQSDKVLETENNVVLSEQLAEKYFGSASPLGQVIELEELMRPTKEAVKKQYVVTGVFRKPLANSHLQFDIITMMESGDSRAFIRLARDVERTEMEALLAANKEHIPVIHAGTQGTYYLESLSSNYFTHQRHSDAEITRDITDVYIALAIGIIIFLISIINYLSLLDNLLKMRERSFVIRRINGSSIGANISMMMQEVLLLVGVSMLLSGVIITLSLPFFNQLMHASISLDFMLHLNQVALVSIVFIVLLVISFVYVIISFKSSGIINLQALDKKKRNYAQFPVFRVFQIASSIVLIIASFTILKQLVYLNNKSLGLDKNVIVLTIPSKYYEQIDVFKQKLKSHACIKHVAGASSTPLMGHWMVKFHYSEGGKDKSYTPCGFSGDAEFVETLDLNLLAGKGFNVDGISNKEKCLINESLLKLFPNQDLLGEKLPGSDKEVVGIVKDFHYSNLMNFVGPAIIEYRDSHNHLLVKADVRKWNEANLLISKIWQEVIHDYPLDKLSLNERYNIIHAENKSFINLIAVCCFISIFLSMIGLFTTSLQMSLVRTKEIGIRKVNGATVMEVISLLTKGYSKWVVAAFIVAAPLGYYYMTSWLQKFAYQTELSWWIFIAAGMLAYIITMLTVAWQSFKVASQNPIKALRYE
ncbi:ABC transporter permease [Carboxylicivirga sp. A043]|uniref:ABC transporter permease n=1 Tax=Carboxylicivirga litoralis TaxID=2816963 RepID=UPI0021CB3966|nr:ABC transporter permease [Carboxylicivirga sp. A043]MCU4156527.1 ABC transporter permease [Carboxylicivirga sp. A043]